jgi:hypothetical protein
MDHTITEQEIAGELSAISCLPRADLIERWKATYTRSPPKGISRRLLEYSAAYQVQVKAYGGLKPSVRRKLLGKTTRSDKPASKPKPPRKSERLSPGARLVREWHGRTYTVEVSDGGFMYDGKTYKSLSMIAQSITGARWSGPRFFGL